jgi:hypothetical protein
MYCNTSISSQHRIILLILFKLVRKWGSRSWLPQAFQPAFARKEFSSLLDAALLLDGPAFQAADPRCSP